MTDRLSQAAQKWFVFQPIKISHCCRSTPILTFPMHAKNTTPLLLAFI